MHPHSHTVTHAQSYHQLGCCGCAVAQTYHAGLKSWVVVVVNTFISNSAMIRTAPALTGPWSALTPVFDIPAEQLAGGAFCYAGKMHPELSVVANEFVFSYMCNTPTINELLDRPDVYTPRLIRTKFTPT